ncbi:molybdopterin-dependent oxidoreductase [Candidatus Nitrospira inopinata]|jgi:formate dehydrogenase alpha subunit|uniref:Putative NADH-quinone oxidoreductase, subunit G n=1 Tax=Candidatus Nitrospira inopinata TaxID=1715989 RepID=A0A0S4KUI4_9BACT|nr:molybdopterin-dependent oxidoreductase [Candidatus Nitrospira inopinata]CUQ66086.1 putative NADH-quinone oxidoreductase, subunit G [Candidatus Nitrospira inopinata]
MGLKPATNPDVEAATIELTIDGNRVVAKDGVSLYDVISMTGKIIPAMCYHYTFDPFGSCGMCLVMQEGKKAPVRSCTAKAAAGMVIRTEGEDLFLARKKAVEKHLSVHPLDCPVCDADGHCELQDMAFEHGVTNLPNAKQKFIPEDTRSLVLDFNMNRCIACAECINVCKDVLMIDALQFMKKGGFNQVVPKGDVALQCEFCGDCLAVCPVGAITNKFSKYLYKPWQMKKTATTCNYCGDGCQLYLETKDEEVIRVTSPLSWKNKWGDRAETAKGHGGLCVRGRFGFESIDSKARLKQPLVREGNRLVEKPWLETMHLLVDRLAEIKRKHGSGAIAGLIAARCTNEEAYLFQKLMRVGFGSNHLDSSARYGHMNFVHAMKRAVGIGRSLNGWEEFTKAKAVLLIGSNVTETNPLTSVRIKEAIRVYKAQVVTLDSAVTNMAKLASHPFLIKPGTEGSVIDGLVKTVIDRDLIDEEVVRKHPEAFGALKAAVADLSLEEIASRTGVSVEAFHEIAQIFAESPRSIILCAEGIVRKADGYRNVLKLVDLAWITGKLGRPGCGVNTVTEEPNEQGVVDMGAAPEFLPGQARFDDPIARERFERAWSASLPAPGTGLRLVDILQGCKTGTIKALYVLGENPLATLPASMEIRSALEGLELLVVQDPFLTETGRMAHVVLPACTYAEKDGTFTNLEGRVLRVRQALDPIGESLPDWHIMTALANAMGCQWEYQSVNDIQAEVRKLVPGYYNLGQPRKVEPLPDDYLANGYAADVRARYAAGADPGEGARPFSLQMGQVLTHSGKLSTEAPGLMKIAPNTGKLRMNPLDMERLGVRDGVKVRVTSERGSLQIGVEPDQSVAPGTCFFPEHFNEPPVKDLMTVSVDAVTGAPAFKQCRVSIEPA